jgi:pimeloyl-ACP methyl ester carboxylesterase
MAHGLGGVKAMRLDAYAERFHAAGYACLVFDYRHFGGSDGQPRQLLSVRRQLQDWTAAVAYARTRPECDPDRVVVWGTSFGGGHALTMAARDHRLAAAIAQCPFTDGIASSLAVPPTMMLRVTALAVLDTLGALLRRRPILIPTAAAPGSVGLMTAPDCLPGYLAIADAAAREAGFDNRVTARTALDIATHPADAPSASPARPCSPSARPTPSPRPKPRNGGPATRSTARSGSTRPATSTSTSATGSKPTSPTNSPSSPATSPSTTDRQRLESLSCFVTT